MVNEACLCMCKYIELKWSIVFRRYLCVEGSMYTGLFLELELFRG